VTKSATEEARHLWGLGILKMDESGELKSEIAKS